MHTNGKAEYRGRQCHIIDFYTLLLFPSMVPRGAKKDAQTAVMPLRPDCCCWKENYYWDYSSQSLPAIWTTSLASTGGTYLCSPWADLNREWDFSKPVCSYFTFSWCLQESSEYSCLFSVTGQGKVRGMPPPVPSVAGGEIRLYYMRHILILMGGKALLSHISGNALELRMNLHTSLESHCHPRPLTSSEKDLKDGHLAQCILHF